MRYLSLFLFHVVLFQGLQIAAQGLMVAPGTCIKVESGTTLDVSGGDLVLKSDATGDASLIDLGNVTYSGGGEANVERYLTNGKWHLVSAPVAGTVAAQFEGDFLQIHYETTNGWADVTSLTYGLIPAKGYALWTIDAAPTTELFTGTTYTGNQSYNFTQNGQGFNLVGNPYPSVLNWDAVTIPAQLGGAIWLFDPTVGENGDYKYYINGGGGANTTTRYIPSGQGFFVRATGGAGTMALDNSDRIHGGQLFYKETQSNEMLVLKATGNNITTQTAIRFIPESTPQIDRLYDVDKIISNSPDVPVVYTNCENQKMAINTLPGITDHETVPVFFEAGTTGNYVFNATELETLDSEVPVFLEDISLNYFQDMRTNPEYSFEYAAGTVKTFNLHFKDVTGMDESVAEASNFFGLLRDGRLQVNFIGSEPFQGSAVISVYNLAGQMIIQTEIAQPHSEIAFNASAAMYILHIQYKNRDYSTKVINN